MINAEILREYDIRGIYQKSLKLEDVENIAKKISNIISNINTPKIIIGHDGRLSSLEIKNKLIDTFRRHGVDVVDISLIPTPVSYYATKKLDIPNLIMNYNFEFVGIRVWDLINNKINYIIYLDNSVLGYQILLYNLFSYSLYNSGK